LVLITSFHCCGVILWNMAKGGLNEQVFMDFEARGGTEALFKALDRVLVRAKE